MSYRIGSGIDFHQLTEGRGLWIGGVLLPHYKGALGHSDADALIHAICDSLLGALALGDIGMHFPDNDPAYRDMDSKVLLSRVIDLVKKEGYKVVNVDSTVTLEMPKIKPYVNKMREIIAQILEVSTRDVSIKATTTEKMGYVGREEGIVAYATALLSKK